MAVKKVAAKKVEKKEEGFLLLIVFKVTHGGMFSKHEHYTTNLIKVKDEEEARNHTRAAKKAAETMTSELGTNTELIISERIKANDAKEMHAAVHAKFGSLSEILENL